MSSSENVKAAPAAPKDKKPQAKRQRNRSPKADNKDKRFQPKLMTEENEDKKTCLIKITRNTGIR